MKRSLQAIWMVAMRDFTQRALSKGFVISSLIVLLFIGGIVAVPRLADREVELHFDLGVLGFTEPRLDQVLRLAAEESEGQIDIATHAFANRPAADRALREDRIDALLIDSTVLVFHEDEDEQLLVVTNRAIYSSRLNDELARLGITLEQARGLLNEDVLSVESLTQPSGVAITASGVSTQDGRKWMAFAGGWLLMISITTYGQWVLLGVIEEKTSRVVEVLLATVPAHQLIAGKVLGVDLVGLAQLAMVGVLLAVEIPLTGAFEPPDGALAMAGSTVLWFLLGFALYATAFAVAGATVGRQEDAQYGSLPVILILLVAYAIATAVSVVGLADATWVRVASYAPPLAPMLIPTRAAIGNLAAWEVVPAAALMLFTIYGLLRLGGRIYAGGQLQTGARLGLRDTWRMARG
ncbi:MAG TPA: ABC transporter permease [Dehalococcoidia bacterium]|nr:ABC transporter permease [Dehalococcoidia bacterium]